MKIWSSQEELFRGFEVWGLHITGGTQLHWYSAGDGEVSWAISLRFKRGQKALYPRNCYTSAVMVSAPTESTGATSFLLFTPQTVIWKARNITWKTVALAGVMEMGAINNSDTVVYRWSLCKRDPRCSLCKQLGLSLWESPSASTVLVHLHSQCHAAAAFVAGGVGGRG